MTEPAYYWGAAHHQSDMCAFILLFRLVVLLSRLFILLSSLIALKSCLDLLARAVRLRPAGSVGKVQEVGMQRSISGRVGATTASSACARLGI